MRSSFILLVLSVCLCSSEDLFTAKREETVPNGLLFQNHWTQFLNQFNHTADAELRKNFDKNMQMIHEHNQRYARGEESYQMGMNQFTGLSQEQFRVRLGLRMDLNTIKHSRRYHRTQGAFMKLASNVNWVTKGHVTPVKNQGACGSCWAFAAVGAIEGQYKRMHGELLSFSEQQLVDCSKKDHGCKGGLMTNAYEYIRNAGGLQLAKDYPYVSDGNHNAAKKCSFNPRLARVNVSEHVVVPPNDEKAVMEALATIGPLSVGISVVDSFKMYKQGVYDDVKCRNDSPNHAVVLVGYGTTSDGIDYWLVKNSWGETWGEKGYMKLKRGICGVTQLVSYPIVG